MCRTGLLLHENIHNAALGLLGSTTSGVKQRNNATTLLYEPNKVAVYKITAHKFKKNPTQFIQALH